MNLQTFLTILLRQWWLIALSVLLTAGSSAFFVAQQSPLYRAASMVELKASAELEDPNEVLGAINALTRRTTINTITRKATLPDRKEQIAEALGQKVDVINDANLVAIAIPDTNIIEIRAESTDPTFAAEISNTAAQLLLTQELEKVLEMEVINQATSPTTPIAPQPLRIVSLALIFGLALGIIFAIVSHTLDQFGGPGGTGDRAFKLGRMRTADVSGSQISSVTPKSDTR